VQDNEFAGDPEQSIKDTKIIQNINREDVMRAYNKYIKNKNYIMTSVVPHSTPELAVANAELATVWIEEVGQMSANEEVSQGAEATYEKTASTYDRSEP
jgi:zinc protease